MATGGSEPSLTTIFEKETEGNPSPTPTAVVKTITEIERMYEWYKVNLAGLETLSPRVGHSLVPLKDGKVLMIGGGQNEGAVSEIWELDLLATDFEEQGNGDVRRTLKKLPVVEGFKARYEFLCVTENNDTEEEEPSSEDKYQHPKIWIFGGANKTAMSDLGYIDNLNWIESVSNAEAPSPRTQGGNTTILEIQDKSYLGVFAGGHAGENSVEDGNLYVYDMHEQNWMTVKIKNDTPPLTQGHVMTGIDSKIFVHGGINGTTLYDSLFMIDLENNLGSPHEASSWVMLDGSENTPGARAAHGLSKPPDSEASPKCFYIFGGLGQSGGMNDLWRFNLESLSWTELSSPTMSSGGESKSFPSPRLDFAMSSIRINDKSECKTNPKDYILIHGGMDTTGELFNDLWAMRID